MADKKGGKGERRGRGTEGLKGEIDHIFLLELSVKNLSDHHGEGVQTLQFFLELNSTQK